MDVNNRNQRPISSTKYSLAATLGDPKRVLHKTMTGSPSYKTALSQNCARIDVNTAAADLGVVTRADVTEIMESCLAKIYDKIKAKVAETIGDVCGDALQSSYLDSNKALKSAMFNIVRNALTEVFYARQRCVLEKIQLARIMQSESIVEKIVS